MKYRPHKGSLADSMAEVAEIAPTRDALVAHLRIELQTWPTICNFHEKHLHVMPYYSEEFPTMWKDVHIVTLDGYGVLGFCEGPV